MTVHLFLAVLAALFLCICNAQPRASPTQALTAAPTPLVNQWNSWKTKNKRSYRNSTEDSRRFKVWQTNLGSIEKQNAAEGGKKIHGITIFSDLTPAEFAAAYLKYVPAERGPGATDHAQSRHLLSTTEGLVDWST